MPINIDFAFLGDSTVLGMEDDKIQTQAEMNQEACQKYQDADSELNKVYKQILDEYKSEPVFIEKLKEAQRAWLVFRNAHLDSLYPEQNKIAVYGTVYPMCRCIMLSEFTNQRTNELRKWIRGIEEGESCSGSIRIKK